MEKKNLYIFVDESGNFDFSSKGTKYFILTCISTINPTYKREALLIERENLKYNLLSEGVDRECFHATEDKQETRNLVFDLINKLSDFEVNSIIVQKNKTNWALYEEMDLLKKKKGFKLKFKRVEEKLYKQISETLLQYIIKGYIEYKKVDLKNIIIVFGAIFNKQKQESIKKYLKSYFKEKINKVPFIYFHQSKTEINCQITDYCSWAIFKKWEREELRPYEQIKTKIRTQFDIFQKGETTYYEYKK